jgi:hypothetical protein
MAGTHSHAAMTWTFSGAKDHAEERPGVPRPAPNAPRSHDETYLCCRQQRAAPVSPYPADVSDGVRPGRLLAPAKTWLELGIAQDDGLFIVVTQSVDVPWETVPRRPVPGRWKVVAAAASEQLPEGVTELNQAMHRALLGRPVDAVAQLVGVPGNVAAALGELAAVAVPLPQDRAVGRAITVMRLGGLVLGLATGSPHLAAASITSLVRGPAAMSVARFIERTLPTPPAPLPDGEPRLRTPRPGPPHP